ncbi:MAG: HlyC/CorC family transporter [Clostridia bacterium]|nr:HlyC/CorC family transporter [Clostridia bacterium]
MILLTGILRGLDASVQNANEAKLTRLASEGNKSAKRAAFLLENSSKLCNSLKILTVIFELSLASITVTTLPETLFANMDKGFGIVLSLVIVGAALLIFGIYMPKRIAYLKGDNILLAASGLIKFLYYIGLPVSVVLTFLSNIFLLVFGIKPNDEEEDVTEEEIRLMVDIGSESGAIDQDEKEMIHNIFELDDTQVKEIMTHRTDTELLWMDEKDEWGDIIANTNHTIYPVCSESIDNIVGILKSTDYYKTRLSGGDITKILREPFFVPETIKADDLFRQMQKAKNHFAVVLDEYGGLGGIITMSDLLEEIVGTLSAEDDETREEDIIQLDSNTWKIAGICDIDLVSETLGIDLPIEEYNTFAGLILSELGEIPADGTTPELEAFGLAIKVTKIEDHRIESTKVAVLEKVQEDQ